MIRETTACFMKIANLSWIITTYPILTQIAAENSGNLINLCLVRNSNSKHRQRES